MLNSVGFTAIQKNISDINFTFSVFLQHILKLCLTIKKTIVIYPTTKNAKQIDESHFHGSGILFHNFDVQKT